MTTATTLDTLSAIEQRRAVKHYDAEFKMPEDEFQKIMDAALQSPTSFNIQNWRFVRVKNKALRAQIKEAAWGQAQVTDASELLILCADLKSWDKHPERYWKDIPQTAQDMIVPMIKPFYEGKEQLQRDEAMRSVGIAGQTIMLASKALGYDSCPMIGFDPVKVAELIHLPADHVVGYMIVVGKALKPAGGRGGQLSKDEVVIIDTF